MLQTQERPAPAEALIIIRAQLADLNGIVHMLEEAATWLTARGIKQWLPGSFLEATSQASLTRDINRGEVYLAMFNGQAVGTLTLREGDEFDFRLWQLLRSPFTPEKALYIHRLAVRRAFAGNAIGGRLLQWAEYMTALAGKPALRLDCHAANTALCAYYEQAGFIERGTAGGPWRSALYEKLLDQ